jgi:hypothetical protein
MYGRVNRAELGTVRIRLIFTSINKYAKHVMESKWPGRIRGQRLGFSPESLAGTGCPGLGPHPALHEIVAQP